MLAPYAVGMTVLWLLPALAALPLALTDYDALSPPEWVGAANLAALAADEIFRTSVFNSLLYVALAVPLRLARLPSASALAPPDAGASGRRLAPLDLIPADRSVPDIAWALVWALAA
jgi:multiple sugar transport system permease protein